MKPISVYNYSVRNAANGTLDVNIDGAVVDAESQQIMKDWFGDDTSVSFKSIRSQIEASGAKSVNVHINSPGGVVTDAMAIHDYLVELGSKGIVVNTYVKGMAASAATYIAMASDNSHISENSWFMIHNVSGGVFGTVDEIENYARTARKFNNQSRDFYASRTGIRKEDISKMMDTETWMTAAEAKEKGFIKNVSGAATFSNAINPKNWSYSNQAVLNAYNSFTQNSTDMFDLTKITEAMTNVLKGFFKKPEDEANIANAAAAVSNALGEQLKPFENFNETITAAVTTAMTNSLKDALTAEKVTEIVNTSIAAATKGFATTEALTTLQNNIAEKLGNPADEKVEDENPAQRKISNKKSFFRVGSFETN